MGRQDNRTASHMWVGRGRVVGGHKAVGAAHSGIVIRGVGGGGWDAADKVRRNGSFPQFLPLGSLDTEHSCYCMVV